MMAHALQCRALRYTKMTTESPCPQVERAAAGCHAQSIVLSHYQTFSPLMRLLVLGPRRHWGVRTGGSRTAAGGNSVARARQTRRR